MMLHVGQFNLPSRERYEAAMRGIFERRYYTNQGPLARAFEARLQTFLQVKHAVCVTNATIALMMASEALGFSGRVIVPAVCNMTLLQALHWCRVQPVFADVNPTTGQLDADALSVSIAQKGSVSGIVGANLWGHACDALTLSALARVHAVPVMFDSSHAFGCSISGRPIGGFGNAEVLSFDAADVINAAGAACVTTDDDDLAARLRNIRSSYGAGRPVAVVKTSNGRMSEAQAAIGLLSLDDYDENRARNTMLADTYLTGLRTVGGVRVVQAHRVDRSNHQMLVCAVDETVAGLSREALIAHLAKHQVEALPVSGFDANEPGAARVGVSWMRLPLGAGVAARDVERICTLIGDAVAGCRSTGSLV